VAAGVGWFVFRTVARKSVVFCYKSYDRQSIISVFGNEGGRDVFVRKADFKTFAGKIVSNVSAGLEFFSAQLGILEEVA